MIAKYNGTTACKVQPCYSCDFPSPVKRPSYSVLDKSKIKSVFGVEVPYWTDSLKKCINNLINQTLKEIEIFENVDELHNWLKENNYPLPKNIEIHESTELKEGFDFTPFKELAIAFGSKPSHISINEGKVSHDGIKYPVYLYQIDEDIKLEKDFINHPNSAFDKGMEFRSKRDLKLKLIDVINE